MTRLLRTHFMTPGFTPRPACWLAAALCLLLAATAWGQQAPAAADASVDPLVQLKQLHELAPARQMGQPGAQAIDQWVRENFTQTVARNNDAKRQAASQELLRQAASKQNDLNRIRNQIAIPTQQLQDVTSSIFVHLTFERPMPGVIVALLVLTLAIGVYFLQKRTGLLILAFGSLLVAVALPIAARLVETPYEKTIAQSHGQSESGSTLEVTARELNALNIQAVQSLRGQWQTGQVTYPAAVFTPGAAHLHGPAGQVRLYQLTPNLVDPGNLPGLQYEGRLCYIGQAGTAELGKVDVRDAAVLMDFNTGKRWIDVVQLGAKVIIFVEPADGQPMRFPQAADKMTIAPLSQPRFFIKRADLAQAMGGDWPRSLEAGVQASIKQSEPGRWTLQESTIDWLFIPSAAGQDAYARQLVHIQAYKDTASFVPELSPGVSSLANLVAVAQLVRHFEAHPPARPVLISTITGHTQAMQGESEFAHFAFASPESILSEQQLNERELAKQLFLAELHDTTTRPLDQARIQYMRVASPLVSGQVIKANKTVLDWLRARRNDLRDQRNRVVHDGERAGSQWTPQQQEAHQQRLTEIDAQAASLVRFMKLFSRFAGQLDYDELSGDEQVAIQHIFTQISQVATVRAARVQRAHQRITDNLAIRRLLLGLADPRVAQADVSTSTAEQIFLQAHQPLHASLVVNLDLTFDNNELGFFAIDQQITRDKAEDQALQRLTRLARYTLEVAANHAKEQGTPNLLQDTIRNVGGVPWQAYLGTNLGIGSRMYHMMNLPAATLTTLRDARPRAFTPSDTLEHLDRDNFKQIMSFTIGYLPRLVDAPDLDRNRRSVGKADSLSVELNIRQQDEFSVSVPQMPVPDSLIVLWRNHVPAMRNRPMLSDVRMFPILMTDERGVAIVRGGAWRESVLSSYRYDQDFSQVLSSLDMGEGAKRFTPLIRPSINETHVSRTFVSFDSAKIDLLGLTEPLLLSPATKLQLLDATQDALPKHFGASGTLASDHVIMVPTNSDGVASIFIDPHGSFKVRAGQGWIINSTESDVSGAGFDASQKLIRNTVITSAQDMWRLTGQRLDLLANKGVSSDTAVDFNNDAGRMLDKARTSRDAGQNKLHLVQAEEARGLAFRAYTRGLSTINDLIKAVVIFLAMVIPFCFFLTKLISPYTDVNRQLALFGLIFFGMAVLLWLVHPAFKIASTPSVVILAFIIMGLAVFVAGVLMSRFNASMNQAVEEALGSESADAPQGRLMGVAFMVGINNMKRRRIRTTLTCVTIVLVTFTMLSVISVGQDVEPARVRVGQETPYSGLLYTSSGLRPIAPMQMRRLRAHFEQDAQLVARVWAQRKGTYGDYLPYLVRPETPMPEASVPSLAAKVVLGLDVLEDGFVGPMPIAPGGRWFSRNDAPEIILSNHAAALLGITPENFKQQTLIVDGQRLTLVGLINDDRFAEMRDLGDLPLTPLLGQATQDSAMQESMANQASGQEALDSGGDLMSAPGIEPARPIDIAIVPVGRAIEMSGANYHTLSIKFANDPAQANPAAASEKTIQTARHFIRYQHARLYAGITHPVTVESQGRTIEAGQYALTSSSSTQVGGVLKVAIPIILAVTIILNTMLGSVMERRREVAIYNAIGLNPGHVMVFFLAESLVFGMIGSVAGYLIGQVLSMLITHFNLVSLNLNYSSLSVMVVIFLTIATVLLSTVYPAMMAARAAVPSGQRRWALPQPVGNQIHVQFPFCYDATRVKGVCAYLREFMYQNSEASTGQFLAKLGPVGTVPSSHLPQEDEAGSQAVNYAMIFDIAPAPFDLGVNQTMEVYAYYDPQVKAHMLSVYLTRNSGETSNWKTVNQPFLESLRKRLLGWRSQKPETQRAYYRQGEQLFASAAPLPVQAADVSADASQGGR